MAFVEEIKSEIARLDPRDRDLRILCLVFFAVLGGLAAYQLHLGSPAWPYLAGGAAVFLILGAALRPRGLILALYRLWMGLAVILGAVVSRIILTVVFYLVITPIGLIRRLTGWDGLKLKKDPAKKSHWVVREEDDRLKSPESYEKMY